MPLSITLHPAGSSVWPELPEDHLPRPRLVDLLMQAAQRRLLLLCAPAGYGKTTLAIEYCRARSAACSVRWLSLSGTDACPGQLLEKLLVVCDGSPDVGTWRVGSPELAARLRQLLSQAAGNKPLLLVLDGYHLARGPETDLLLTRVLECLPADAQLLLTCRQPPDWQLARWRLSGQLFELPAQALCCDQQEACWVLQKSGLGALDSELLALALQRNQGWMAGLRLLGVAARNADSAALQRLIAEGNWAEEYLLQEVLAQLPADMRVFVEQTGVAGSFTAALCDWLRQADDSAVLIERLLQLQVFLYQPDGDDSYSFHLLLVDVLRRRLRRDRARWRSLCRRASDWYAEQGALLPAIAQALQADDRQLALRLLEQLPLAQLLAEQPVAELLEWRSRLPELQQGGSKRLALINAWTLALAGQLEDAAGSLLALQRFLPQPDRQRQQALLGAGLALRAWLGRAAGRLQAALEDARAALDCLPTADTGSRIQCMLVLADAEFCRQRSSSANGWARQAVEAARRANSPLLEAQAELMRARLLQARGEPSRARQLIGQQRSRLLMPGPQAIRARLAIYDGYLLGQLGDQDAALQVLTEGIDEARRCHDVHVVMGCCARAALLAQTRGGSAGAFAALAEAERLMHLWDIPPVFYLAWVTAIKSDLWITSGRLDLAGHWLPRLRQTYCLQPSAAPPAFFHALPAVIEQIYARYLASNGDQLAAESLLRQLAGRLQQQGERLQQLSVLISLVRLLYRNQRPEEAEHSLLIALALADRDCIAGPFHSLLLQAPGGLAGALQRAPASALRDRLLGMLPLELGRVSGLINDPLSKRELDVLRCIAQGYSNQQISQALFISLHTVKTHARRINHKLGVARRTQAVAQAKRLGLI